MATDLKRKLTTILCADVKSYSHLMEEDERATFDQFRDYRDEMASLIRRHDGRVVNTWGDAVIAEFASVVEAVQCAVEIQQELSQRNQTLPDTRRMWFRIGINLGDVMIEDDDLYGEGVNIAARLQEVADPGGIAISRTVYDQVRHKMSVDFASVGSLMVKNIDEPVETYRIELDAAYASEPEETGIAARITRLAHAAEDRIRRLGRTREFQTAQAWWSRRPIWMRIVIAIFAFVTAINVLSTVIPLLIFVGMIVAAVYVWPYVTGTTPARKDLTEDKDESPA